MYEYASLKVIRFSFSFYQVELTYKDLSATRRTGDMLLLATLSFPLTKKKQHLVKAIIAVDIFNLLKKSIHFIAFTLLLKGSLVFLLAFVIFWAVSDICWMTKTAKLMKFEHMVICAFQILCWNKTYCFSAQLCIRCGGYSASNHDYCIQCVESLKKTCCHFVSKPTKTWGKEKNGDLALWKIQIYRTPSLNNHLDDHCQTI